MDAHPPKHPSPFPIVLLSLIVLLGGAIAIGMATGGDDDDDDGGPAANASAEWDPRVADLASFVEDERSLAFEHPIEVAFLAEDEFRARVTRQEEPTPDERDELDQLAGIMRALGLAEGELDLLEVFDQLTGETVIGLYDPESDSIAIRGDTVTPEMRPTLVHELTHALQAQYHDLSFDRGTSGEDLAFRTLVEADAVRIERAFVQTLSPDEQQAVLDDQRETAEAADLDGVPEVLTELFATPYALGPPWLDSIERDGGDDAVEDAFDEPPTSEEQIVLPERFLDRDEVVDVDDPALDDGEEAFGEPGDFGMLSLLLVLGERLPYADAWDASVGWEGDAMVTYRADGRDCLRVAFAMESAAEAAELEDALERWADAGADATIEREGALTELSACDPGAEATRPTIEGARAFEVLALRVNTITGLREAAGFSLEQAACATDRLIATLGPDRLVAEFEGGQPDPETVEELQQVMFDAVTACR